MSIFLCTVKCLTHTHRIWAGLWSAWTNRMQQKWCCASSKPGLRRPCWLLLLSGPWMPPCEQAQANLLEDETMWSRGDRPILDHPKPAYSQLLPSRRQICTQTEVGTINIPTLQMRKYGNWWATHPLALVFKSLHDPTPSSSPALQALCTPTIHF